MRKQWITAWTLAGICAASAATAQMPNSVAPPALPEPGGDRWYEPITSLFRSDSASPELYASMAEMSLRGGNVPHARSLYQKAIQQDPVNVTALLGAARMEDREGQLDVALTLYDRAAKAQPQNPVVLNDLALCVARRGDLPGAERIMQQAIGLNPRNQLYRNNIAKILVEMNRVDHAMAQLSAVHPPAVVQYNTGVLLAERGRTHEAIQHASAAVAIDPRFEQAHAFLAQLAAGPGQQAATQSDALSQSPPVEHSILSAPGVDVPSQDAVSGASILPTPGAAPALATPNAMATLPGNSEPTLLPPIN